MDVGSASDELVSSSFVDRTIASDATAFLDVALVASVFGLRKLEITPMRIAIEADVEFLQQIGATSASALRHGVRPRIEKLFQNVATRLASGRMELSGVVPSLEFICRQYPMAWLMLSKLHEEGEEAGGLRNAAECLQRFLKSPQTVPDQRLAWENLARIYQESGEWTGAAQAQIRRCELPDTPFSEISNIANWLNGLLRENHLALDSDEKRLLYRELAQLMERRASEADATDLSRLAWLYLHLHDAQRAREIVETALKLDRQNEHCLRLKQRLEREELIRRTKRVVCPNSTFYRKSTFSNLTN